jgi:5-methylcytosine-specific restriction enzyme A
MIKSSIGSNRKKRLTCHKPALSTATASTSGWKPDEQRGNRHERGYGTEWEKTRERIKQRAKGLCEPHMAEGLVHPGNECDHITSKAEAKALGWTTQQIEAEENLQWCCTDYHREKTAHESLSAYKSRGGA